MVALWLGIVLVFLLVEESTARLRRYEDTSCILTGSAPRDAREAHVFETTRTQDCFLFAGPNTHKPGRIRYKVVSSSDSPKKFVWRIESSTIQIDASNLDMGTEPNEMSHAYVHALDDAPSTDPKGTAITGMVLGAKLGGSGLQQQNLFPTSVKSQPAYKQLEDTIHECLKSGKAHRAQLEHTFQYQTLLRTRPYSVWYSVQFIGENNAASSCANIELHLDN
jgi:hypothetical protein